MTLTQAATLTKRSFLVIGILIVVGILARVGFSIWYQYYLASLPKVEERPEKKFGDLPLPTFPTSTVSSSNFTYSIVTQTGGFPTSPKFVKAYYIPQLPVTLLSNQRAQDLALKLGFNQTPQNLSESNQKFMDESGGSLTVDITTGNFQIQRSATASAIATSSAILSEDKKLLEEFNTYLTAKGLLTDSLTGGRPKVSYDGPTPSESQTALVSIWPKDFDDLPILTGYNNRGLVWALVVKSNDEIKKFFQVGYTVWNIDQTTSSTYQVKTYDQAYAELQAGRGFITLAPKNNPKIPISKAYLAYYETDNYTSYLQPIYVFEGESFQGLVPAITN